MDHIPNFKLNDWVRIMQTTDMEKRGIANRQGYISNIDPDGNATVACATSLCKCVPLAALQKMPRPR